MHGFEVADSFPTHRTVLMVLASMFQHCRPCWRDPVWILLQRERPVDRSHQPVVALLRAVVISGGVLVLASVLKQQAVAGVELVINGEAAPTAGQTPTFGLHNSLLITQFDASSRSQDPMYGCVSR